ncbi:MAG: SDR family oxidoreductase [Myxococcota bacterium]|nr:SDR family oxidoreductase [Myxococcota bacterium]
MKAAERQTRFPGIHRGPALRAAGYKVRAENPRKDKNMKLSDVKAIVTGGASGMGRAFTLGLAAAGSDVVACDISAAGLAETIDAAKELPGSVYGLEVDVTQEEQVQGLIADAEEALGGLNVLVNNAGIFLDSKLVSVDRETGKVRKSMSLDQWNRVIDVDLTGPFLCTREFAINHIDRRSGSEAVVVNMSSVSRHGNPGQTNYSAAKAGLVADTKLWALEMARYGLRFGAIAPGFVQTPILDGMPPEVLKKLTSVVPLKRVGTTDEILLAVKFIIECGYFTGRCIDIDGGFTP